MVINVHPLMNIADWEALPNDGNRYEIIEGELFVSCSPGLTHQIVLGNLIFLIRTYLEANNAGVVVSTPGLILSDFSGVIPDLVFFRPEKKAKIISGERLKGPPDLVIEILSPGAGNERRDRVAKLELYARHGVPEYWIVNPSKQALEVFRLKGDSYELEQSLAADDELSSSEIPGFVCKVSKIFAQ